MSAFGRGNWRRRLLLQGVGAAAVAYVASFAMAGPQSPSSLSGADVGAETRMLAPFAPEFATWSSGRVSSPLVGEDQGGGSRRPPQGGSGDVCDNLLSVRDPPPLPAPARGGGCANAINFGDPDSASPLLGVFNAARVARDSTLEAGLLAEPRFDLASAAALGEAPPTLDDPPRVDYDPTAGPRLSPIQMALQAAIERLVTRGDRVNPLGLGDWRAARDAIAVFYAARFYAPVWIGEDGLTQAGRAVLSQLARAREDGLDLSGFKLPQELKPGLAPDALAEAETTIASGVVTYAEQATGSRVPPSRVSRLIFATLNVADARAALAETAVAADPAERLADFNPPQNGYRELRDELKRLIDAAPMARKSGAPAAGRIHTASASTSDAFAFGPLARQKAAILANMEMWRWEPRDMGERRIEVNVADFSAAALEGDRVILRSRVIVGKPETPTPIFSNIMRYVIINPSWRVPESIIKKELAPKLGALSRRGYEVKTVGGRLTVRQLPGDDNALGRLAFMFPNDHAIYLHDTPARELFDEETRAFSHGCVRVEDPLSLAELVLGGEKSGWTEEQIESAFGDKERTVFLPHPLPIHIVYFTEFVDEFGELQERPDVYGLIRKVEGILARSSQD
jgi:L,D-transpeptidase YcbB